LIRAARCANGMIESFVAKLFRKIASSLSDLTKKFDYYGKILANLAGFGRFFCKKVLILPLWPYCGRNAAIRFKFKRESPNFVIPAFAGMTSLE